MKMRIINWEQSTMVEKSRSNPWARGPFDCQGVACLPINSPIEEIRVLERLGIGGIADRGVQNHAGQLRSFARLWR
jgi:hypothetical protein